MQRLPIRGGQLLSPAAGLDDLKLSLQRLSADVFNQSALQHVLERLAQINGSWLAIEESKQSGPVSKNLLKLSKDLNAASKLLNGHANGLHTTTEIFATSLVCELLRLDPSLKIDSVE